MAATVNGIIVWCVALDLFCVVVIALGRARLDTYVSTQSILNSSYHQSVRAGILPVKTLATVFDKPTNNCLQTLTQCVRDTDCTSSCDVVPGVSGFECDRDTNLCMAKSSAAAHPKSDKKRAPAKPKCYPELGVFPVFRTDTVFNVNVWQCFSFYPEFYDARGVVNPSLCKPHGEFRTKPDNDGNPYTGGYCVCSPPHVATFTDNGLPFCTINHAFYSRLAQA